MKTTAIFSICENLYLKALDNGLTGGDFRKLKTVFYSKVCQFCYIKASNVNTFKVNFNFLIATLNGEKELPFQ